MIDSFSLGDGEVSPYLDTNITQLQTRLTYGVSRNDLDHLVMIDSRVHLLELSVTSGHVRRYGMCSKTTTTAKSERGEDPCCV